MADAGFWGCCLIAGGPPLVVFTFLIGRHSFLALICFASSFIWLISLLFISAVFRAFEPLPARVGPYVVVMLVSVLIQEGVRYLVWQGHRRSVIRLEAIAQEGEGTRLTAFDRQALALTHGFAHGAMHSLFFTISWLPLMAGDITFYARACSSSSYFLISALQSLGFFMLHTGSMAVAFEGAERKDTARMVFPSLAHLAVALMTLINFAQDGCVFSTPLVLLSGAAMAVEAFRIAWRSATAQFTM